MKSLKAQLRFLRLCAILLVTALLPLALMLVFYTLTPDAYTDSYYAELPVKTERLDTVPGQRVVVIGGSSVAFGIDSKLIETELGMPCVNFGLYAAFGLKPMLDLAEDRLHEGDIVVIAPEITSQMYSTYCGYDYLLQAFETRPSALIGLGTDYAFGLSSKVPGYRKAARALRAQGGAPVAGVYALSSFDEYGDIIYPREENVMELGYSEDNLPEIDEAIVTKDFIDMINGFVKTARRSGAEVYFSFCPVNALSVKAVPEETKAAFEDALRRGLYCELLSPLSDHIMDEGFFYDSNYHLTSSGMKYNSLMLVSDLMRTQGDMRLTSAVLPHAPVLQRDNAVLASGVENGIRYDVTARGSIVTGLEDAAKGETALTIPETLGGSSVITVSAGVFDGCMAEEITLPASITRLPGRLFAGAKQLKTVNLFSEELPEVGDELLKDANADLILRVPRSAYGTYITDYFWGIYSESTQAMN